MTSEKTTGNFTGANVRSIRSTIPRSGSVFLLFGFVIVVDYCLNIMDADKDFFEKEDEKVSKSKRSRSRSKSREKDREGRRKDKEKRRSRSRERNKDGEKKQKKKKEEVPVKSVQGWVILISNLESSAEYNLIEDDFRDLCSSHGEVGRILVGKSHRTGVVTYALVEFATRTDGEKACELNDTEWKGSKIKVGFAFVRD